MTEDARAELQRELGGDLQVLDLLSEQESSELLTMFRDARREEKESLDQAIDEALGALPRILRGPARSIMFGKAQP